jgi:hypothetical protein
LSWQIAGQKCCKAGGEICGSHESTLRGIT